MNSNVDDNEDLDPFARYRPGFEVSDSFPDEELDDLDEYASYRPQGEEEVKEVKKPKKKTILSEEIKSIKEIPQQLAKRTLIGAGGTYGDLGELLKPEGFDEAEEEKYYKESDILDKLQQPGYVPSIAELETLSDDSIVPKRFTPPRTKDLEKLNEKIGGPGEPETLAGKTASRIGTTFGAGLATGQVNPLPAIAAGVAGQTAEEFGGGPLTQAAAEIGALLLTQGRGLNFKKIGDVFEHATPEIKSKINELRKLGYSDKEITLAINSANPKSIAKSKKASKGASTAEAFEDFAEHSDQLVSDILTSSVEGLEHGTEYVHKLANQAYGKVVEEATKVVIKDPNPAIKSMISAVKKARNNLVETDEAKKIFELMSEAAETLHKQPTADKMIEFYKLLNKKGNWTDPKLQEHLLTEVKEGIKASFKSEGKAGAKLAEDFERVNAGIQKAYKAEKAHDIIQKAYSESEGFNFKKLLKQFDNPDNVTAISEVVGPEATKNLRLIARTGADVKNFDKGWKGANAFRPSAYDAIRVGGAAYEFWQGDYVKAAAFIASKGAPKVVQKLREKSLTDPKFQNLFIRGLHAIKTSSPQAMKSATEAMNKYFKDEDIDIKI